MMSSKPSLAFFALTAIYWLFAGVTQVLYSQEELILLVNRHHSPFADIFFKYTTYLGDGIFYLFITLILFFIHRKKAVFLLIAYASTTIVVQTLKLLVFPDVARPWGVFENRGLSLHFVEGVELHVANSFPSGHTTSAFALALCCAIFLKNKYLSVLLSLLAIAVAYSRMYLFQHFLIDVFVGSILGTSITYWIYLKWFKVQAV